MRAPGGLIANLKMCRRADEAAEELQSLLEEEQLGGLPLLVFANKQESHERQVASHALQAASCE